MSILAAAGACWRLSELVNTSVAKQVLLADRRLNAAEAQQLGLVIDVVPGPELVPAAHALLDRIGRASPTALRLTKLVADAKGPHPLADNLAQAVLFEPPDKHERMTRFLERRTS